MVELTPLFWAALPAAIVGIVQVVLGLGLLVLAWDNRASRIFGLFILARGAANSLQPLFFLPDPDLVTLGATVFGYAGIVVVLLAILFVAVFPRERTFLGTTRWAPWALLAVILAADAVLAFNPHLLADYVVGADGFAIRSVGPYLALNGLAWLVYGVMAFVLARDLPRVRTASMRTTVLLIYLGFGLVVITSGFGAVAEIFAGTYRFGGFEAGFWGNVLVAFRAVAPIPVLAGAVLLWRRASPDTEHGRATRRAVAALALPLLTIPLQVWGGPVVSGIVRATWQLALPVLVAYGLVRHRVFDIDLKVKWTVSRGTVAAVFVAVFFVVSEGAQQFFAGTSLGPWLGLVAAGALVFALAPLQRFADRVADAAMPGTHETEAYRAERTEDVYRSAVEMALSDGVVDDADEMSLARLADELGLSTARAVELRREVETGSGTGDAGGGA